MRWAVLIGCEHYERATPLKYTVNDVHVLSGTLINRGGYKESHVLTLTDDEKDSGRRSIKENILQRLPELFEKTSPGDSVLVYFTGHGFRDADGKLYLAPLDVDPTNPSATGVEVDWLRQQIASCKANFKLLILDACHAGSEKGSDEAKSASIGEKDLQMFSNLDGVATIASSKADEKSQIWYEKEQSLFSYWLNEGLKGNADDDADGSVDFGELYTYVLDNVSATAKNQFPLPQTPVRVVRTGIVGDPAVINPKPTSLREVLSDCAELLSNYVESGDQTKVGVLEFTNAVGINELLGANYGELGKWCTEEFERRLTKAGRGKFVLIDQRRLQNALKTEGFTINDLGTDDGFERLSKRVGGMPIVAIGTLSNRRGRLVTIKCQLLNVKSEKVGETIGTAQLNESEWAMLGRSVQITTEDRRPAHREDGRPDTPRPIAVVPVSVADTVIRRADERSRIAHPLKNPQFEYPITIKARRGQTEWTT